MARKNIEALYDVLFNMRAAMEDICQDAEGLLNDVSEYGGELNRVVKEQLSKYFIPGVSKLIKDEQTPGSIIGLIRFMDSLPLAMTRVEPSVENVAPVMSNNAKIEAPAASAVDTLPQNASFQNPVNTEAPVQESKKKLENKKFAESFEFVEPKDIFKQMLKDSGNEETGPFGRQNPITEDGFYLEWQNASYEVNYDPYDGTWYIHSEFDVDDTYSDEEYDEANYTKSGRGWNNMVDAMFGDPDLGSYPIHRGLVYNTGVEKTAKDYYIENFKLKESKKEVKRPFQNNHSKLTESDNYCGVPGVRMIWHGEWADPELEYKGKLYSYPDVEDWLLADYDELYPEDENRDGFYDWVSSDPENLYLALNEIMPKEDSNYSESCEKVQEAKEEKCCCEETCKYQVIRTSKMESALGKDVANLEPQVVAEFDCEECAKERADKLNLTVLPSEKELFGTEYKVEKKCIEVCEPEHFDTKEAMKDAK